MSEFQRRGGKGMAVGSPPLVLQRQPSDPPSDDMFGADDADWAIYRKIVCCFQLIDCISPLTPITAF